MSARDRIRLAGLSAVGHHGVFDHERQDGQPFVTDVVLHLDAGPAAAGDDLARTANYAEVADTVVRLVTGEPVDLIETLADRIARAVLAEQPVVAAVGHRAQAAGAHPARLRGRRRHRAPHPGGPRVSTVDWSHPAEGPATIPELGARPDAPVAAVLALGANLREPAQTLDASVAALSALPHITDVRASPRAVTTPVGGPPGQPDYLNQVVTLRTNLAPWELLAVAHRLEQDHHRRREVRWGARTLDVDVIAYGDVRSDHPDLTLPHPRAAERAFVLLPWLWLDADATLAGTPVADLAAVAADAPGVRRQEPERHRLLAGTDDVAPLRPARPDALGREAT